MSFRTKEALRECLSPASTIQWKIRGLGDKELKAFMQGAEDYFDPADPVVTAFWKGVIGTAEKEIEVRAARKSPKGKWFAALEAMTEDPRERGVSSQSTIEFRECNGRAEAIAAAR